jgi:alkylation response protein AidB-like acyl-CoA dehydrogenase
MDFRLTDDHRQLRDAILKFARAELSPGARDRDRDHRFDRELFRKCGTMGLTGLPVPEELGGAGLDPLSTAIALEAFGYGCEDGGLVFSVCAHLLACVIPIWKHGSDAQKATWLPELASGRLIAVNAMTESGTGSDAFAMQTRAVADGDGFIINGTKTFSTNGPEADLALVYAMTAPEKGFHGGVTAFLVPSGTPGFSPGQRFEKLGLRTSPIGELVFDNVRVPADAVLGKVGGAATIFTESMDWERACLIAAHVGTMQRLLDRAIEHARSRRQFGQLIAKYQAVSHRIADMRIRLEAAQLMTYKAAAQLDSSRMAGLYASMAKTFVSEALVQSALDTVQILGGYGFMVEYDVERVLRDAVGGTIYSGTSEMQRNVITRWLGL